MVERFASRTVAHVERAIRTKNTSTNSEGGKPEPGGGRRKRSRINSPGVGYHTIGVNGLGSVFSGQGRAWLLLLLSLLLLIVTLVAVVVLEFGG